jgi:hypothetical protein
LVPEETEEETNEASVVEVLRTGFESDMLRPSVDEVEVLDVPEMCESKTKANSKTAECLGWKMDNTKLGHCHRRMRRVCQCQRDP